MLFCGVSKAWNPVWRRVSAFKQSISSFEFIKHPPFTETQTHYDMKIPTKQSALALLVLASFTISVHAEIREFIDTSGRSLRGVLLEASGENVTIRREDGQVFRLKVATFSAADQAYIRQQAANGAATGPGKKEPPAKLTPKDFRVLPFCSTEKAKKLDPKSKGIFNELRVTTSERIRIHGKKEDDTGRLDGKIVFHTGKLALFPPGERSGQLTTKFPTQNDVRSHFAVMELADSLNTKEVKIEAGKTYTWTVKEDRGNTFLKIESGGVETATLMEATSKLKGIGFAATARWTGNEVDLIVTFDEGEK